MLRGLQDMDCARYKNINSLQQLHEKTVMGGSASLIFDDRHDLEIQPSHAVLFGHLSRDGTRCANENVKYVCTIY